MLNKRQVGRKEGIVKGGIDQENKCSCLKTTENLIIKRHNKKVHYIYKNSIYGGDSALIFKVLSFISSDSHNPTIEKIGVW